MISRKSSRIDLVLVLATSTGLTLLLLYMLQFYDLIHFTGRAGMLSVVPGHLYYHLRSSVFFFAAALVFFLFSLRSLSARMSEYEATAGALTADDKRGRLSAILNLDGRTDIAITTFFGIGVIYTAIGMESALLTALGGIEGAEAAARQGAWEILRKLVDGGLVLALSTTIFGGIGGYSLRLLKHVVVGKRLTQLLVAEERKSESVLLRVSENVEKMSRLLEGLSMARGNHPWDEGMARAAPAIPDGSEERPD